MFKRIDHVEILPGNFEKSMAFYQNVLEFRLLSRKPVNTGPLKETAYLQLGDTVIELMHVKNLAHMPSSMTVGCRAIALEVESRKERLITFVVTASILPGDLWIWAHPFEPRLKIPMVLP